MEIRDCKKIKFLAVENNLLAHQLHQLILTIHLYHPSLTEMLRMSERRKFIYTKTAEHIEGWKGEKENFSFNQLKICSHCQ